MRRLTTEKLTPVLLVLALLVAACTSTGSTDGSSAPEGTDGASTSIPTDTNPASGGEPRTLVVYGSGNPEQSEPLDLAFEAFYLAETGEEVDVDTRHAPDGAVDALIDLEVQGGEVQADVLDVSEAQLISIQEKHGILKPVDLSFTDDPAIPESIREVAERTGFVPRSVNPYGIAFNTEILAPEDVPTSWADLLDERWNGLIGMGDPEVTDGAHVSIWLLSEYLAGTVGEPFGWEYFERFGELNPTLTSGHGLLAELVASGELQIGIMGVGPVLRSALDGNPVSIVFPEEGISGTAASLGIVAGRPNEDLAMAYLEWSLSREGQIEMRDGYQYMSVRTDVDFEDAPFPIDIDMSQVFSVDSQWVAEKSAENIERFRQAMQSG